MSASTSETESAMMRCMMDGRSFLTAWEKVGRGSGCADEPSARLYADGPSASLWADEPSASLRDEAGEPPTCLGFSSFLISSFGFGEENG